uniref:Uncharacterized protein n=1 Tax=Gasterosteus aculeatus TaxID=69293 RepID=G3Q3V5_GASAC
SAELCFCHFQEQTADYFFLIQGLRRTNTVFFSLSFFRADSQTSLTPSRCWPGCACPRGECLPRPGSRCRCGASSRAESPTLCLPWSGSS